MFNSMDLQIPKLADLQMDNELDNASEMPADLPWQLLEEITNGFSEERKIGSGGYGVVYKGVYKNGEEIAVKKLYHMPGLDDMQFQNELQSLTRLRHQNIVRLVGKSYDEKERCVEYQGKLVCAKMIDRVICLEYLHNGSLEKHLSDESSGLPWHRRYEIIKGICDGLKYLHERGIFHLDLKPANILLDKNMVPKIADFGLSRLFSGTRQSHTTSKFLGTLGYVPPEYIEKGKISEKFDVFSLGVIIIGIMTGPDGYFKQSDRSSQNIVEHVLENWSNRPQEQWKDASYFDVFCQLKICIEIALNCVETDRHKRHSIGDIICKLNESETMIEKSDKVLARDSFYTIDVHPIKPWILTDHGSTGIQILNYRTQTTVMSLKLGNIFSGRYGPAETAKSIARKQWFVAKFIARKQWFVVGGCYGSILVYCYTEKQEVKSFVAHSRLVTSLAIHPTEPFVLSASENELNIKLWDWEKGWECTRIFEMRSPVHEMAFNPKDTNTFATAYADGGAEIWNLGSPDSSFTLGEDKHTSCSLDYFASGDRQYLITAFYYDRAPKIWDLQKKSCVKTLGHKKRVTAVCSHPELPILMTASDDGTIYLWNSTTFRLKSDTKILADSLDYEKEESRKLKAEAIDALKKLKEANSATIKAQENLNKKEYEMQKLRNEVREKTMVIQEITRISKGKDQEVEKLSSRMAEITLDLKRLEKEINDKTSIYEKTVCIAKKNAEDLRSWEKKHAETVTSHGEEVKKLDSQLVEQVVEIKKLREASTHSQQEMESMKVKLQGNITLLNNVLGELHSEGKSPRDATIAALTSTIGDQVGTLHELVTTLKANQAESIKDAVETAVSYALAKLKAHDPNLNVQPIDDDFDCPEAEARRLMGELLPAGRKVSEEMQLGSPSSD